MVPLADTITIDLSNDSQSRDTPTVWVQTSLYTLHGTDRPLILSPSGWLNDKIIHALQMLLIQHFPDTDGLEPPTLEQIQGFQLHFGEFVQLLNVRNSHWIVVSNLGCDKDVGNVSDTMYPSILSSTVVCSEPALHCCRQHVHLCKLWFTNFCVCVSALYIIRCVGRKFENPKFKIEQRMSCEPARTRAYHSDLRWRMIYQRYVLNRLLYKVNQPNLCVDKTTVRRVLRLFDSTGSVDKRESQASRKKICITDQLHILELLLESPSMYLAELKREMYSRGTDVHISTICRFLQSSNFSKKKIRLIATQQSDELRGRYIAEVALYSPNMLIFVDETGCNRKDAIRRFGYSLRGKRCTAKRLLCRGQRVSAVAALSFERILDVKFVRGSLCGEGFSEFVELNLLSHLLPFNGSNPNSIVVLDNASSSRLRHASSSALTVLCTNLHILLRLTEGIP